MNQNMIGNSLLWFFDILLWNRRTLGQTCRIRSRIISIIIRELELFLGMIILCKLQVLETKLRMSPRYNVPPVTSSMKVNAETFTLPRLVQLLGKKPNLRLKLMINVLSAIKVYTCTRTRIELTRPLREWQNVQPSSLRMRITRKISLISSRRNTLSV